MQSKWRAPACYVGVAALCVLYLAIVPGVNLIDVCAGAGVGAALMWAINEWETGKWNVPVPAGLSAAPRAHAAPMTASAATAQTSPVTETPWQVDEKEPSWDESALAETWAKLRTELSINGNGPRRHTVAADLPRTAELARGPQFLRNGANAAPASRPAAASSASSLGNTGTGSSTTRPAATSGAAKPAAGAPTLGQPASGKPASTKSLFNAASTVGKPAPLNHTSAPLPRKTASAASGAVELPTSRLAQAGPPAFLRPGTSRPR